MYIQHDINANPIVFIVYICASVFICLYVHNPYLRKLINKCLLLQKEKTGWAVRVRGEKYKGNNKLCSTIFL